MKALKISAAFIAALMMFSCAKDTTKNPDNGPKNLNIKVQADAATKSVYDPAVQNQVTTIDPANSHIFFLDGANVILDQVALTAEALTTNAADPGQIITDLSSSVSKVYVIANYPSVPSGGWAGFAGKNISVVEAVLYSMTTQNPAYSATAPTGLENVMLACEAPVALVKVSDAIADPATNAVWKADVSVTPTVARLEINKIGQTAISEISSFNIEGIYIDYVYPDFTVKGGFGGNVLQGKPADYPTWPAWASQTTGFVAYDVETNKPGYKAPEDQVWGFQVPVAVAGDFAVPRIVVKVTDIVMDDAEAGSYETTRYITVKGYQEDVSGTLKDIEIFQRGVVYNVEEILFDQTNSHTYPHPTEIDIKVKVVVKPWVVKKVYPIVE